MIPLRLHGLPPKEVAANAVSVIRKHAEDLEGAFSVIAMNSIRIGKGNWQVQEAIALFHLQQT